MKDGLRPARAMVPSPCINVCRMNPASGLCEGCLRTLDEIAAWSTATDTQKSLILAAIARRRTFPATTAPLARSKIRG